MNWPAIVTGVVGIVGIVANYLQNMSARKSASGDLNKSLESTSANLTTRITAENRRTLQAEKQRVYSELQGSMDDVFVTAVQLHDRVYGRSDLDTALRAMYKATAAVKLIAPESLGEVARTIARQMAEETGTPRVGTEEFDRDNIIYNKRQELYTLMREDLGVDNAQE